MVLPQVVLQEKSHTTYFDNMQTWALLKAPESIKARMASVQAKYLKQIQDTYIQEKQIYFVNRHSGLRETDYDEFMEHQLTKYRETKDLFYIKETAKTQRGLKHYMEAAYGFLLCSYLQSLLQPGTAVTPRLHDFILNNEPAMMNRDSYPVPQHSDESLVNLLEQAYSACSLAKLSYYSHELLGLLLQAGQNKTPQQIKVQRLQVAELGRQMAVDEQNTLKQYGFYYKVSFYGSEFGERLDKRQFVYAEPTSVRSDDFQAKVRRFYDGKLRNPVRIVQSNCFDAFHEDLSRTNFVQICTVQPYPLFGELEGLTDRGFAFSRAVCPKLGVPSQPTAAKTPFQEAIHNKLFYHTAPNFTGGDRGKAENVGRSVRFFVTRDCFPGVLSRQEVVEEFTEIWEPIKHNTDLIKQQYRKLRSLKATQSDISQLQLAIQGSIMTTVNAGPLYLAQKYLSCGRGHEAAIQTGKQQQDSLRKVLVLFLKEAKDLLLIANKRADREYIKLQKALCSSFVALVSEISPYLDIDARQYTAGIAK